MGDLHHDFWPTVKEWLVPPLLVPLFLAIGLALWITVRPPLDTPEPDNLLAQPQTNER